MVDQKRCAECGLEVSADAPQGLCPGCLLKRGLETNTYVSEGGFSSAASTPPTPAELGAYFPDLEILELIGRGGMGMVYKARQKQLGRIVALKILSPTIGQEPAFAERFTREARSLAMLSHPHIVTVYNFGQTNGLYYFLMEFVDGVTLRQLLEAGKLAPEEALAIVPQICEALQYAHDKGVVHRDIKPENILMDKTGEVKIADFGLAKIVGREPPDLSLSGTNQVMGTPYYMAPEQTERPREVDHRADIYSLGVVFYQMLTGELPLGRFAPPSKKVQIDVRLDEVVLRALEKEPEKRFQKASEIKTEVESIITTSQAGTCKGVEERISFKHPFQFADLVGLLFLGGSFTSPAARKVANVSALGFLGFLCFLGYLPFSGMERCFGFSGLFGIFGLIGAAVMVEFASRRGGIRRWAISTLVLLAAACAIGVGVFLARNLPFSGMTGGASSEGVESAIVDVFTTPRGPWIAKLPQGDIELVAVSYNPSKNEPWWRPDGSRCEDGPFANEGSRSQSSDTLQGYEFVVRPHGLPEHSSLPDWKFEGGAGWAFTDGQKPNGEPLKGYYCVSASLPGSLHNTNVQVGVATDTWQTLDTVEATGYHAGGAKLGKQQISLTFAKPVDTADGGSVVNVSFSKVDGEVRMIAIDDQGKEVHPFSAPNMSVGESAHQISAVFEKLPLKRVKQFRFQARPYHWVEFRNVALAPKFPFDEKNRQGLEMAKESHLSDQTKSPKPSNGSKDQYPSERWKTLAETEIIDVSSENNGAVFAGVIEKDGEIVAAVSYPHLAVGASLFVIDRKGVSHGTLQYSFEGTHNMPQIVATFPNLKKSDVAKMVLQCPVDSARAENPPVSFGPVIVRTLFSDTKHPIKGEDLDGGRVITLPEDVEKASQKNENHGFRWLAEQGVDLFVSIEKGPTPEYLLIATPELAAAKSDLWDKAGAVDVQEALDSGEVGPQLDALAAEEGFVFYKIKPDSTFPLTYAFKTREGNRGLLQILGFTESASGLKIRYKMLKSKKAEKTPENVELIVPVELALEDNAQKEITIACEREKILKKAAPGTVQLDLTGIDGGQRQLYFHCPGYASQWVSIRIVDHKPSPNRIQVTLYRTRYVVLKCAYNTRGGLNLEGEGVEEKRVVLSHWHGVMPFNMDWQIWQRGRETGVFGNTPYFNCHNIAEDFGFMKPAADVAYDQMKEAPETGYSSFEGIPAEKGLVLYCRIRGNQNPNGWGFGKILVESVTETPPADMAIPEERPVIDENASAKKDEVKVDLVVHPVDSKQPGIHLLPMSLKAKIAGVPGVKHLSPVLFEQFSMAELEPLGVIVEGLEYNSPLWRQIKLSKGRRLGPKDRSEVSLVGERLAAVLNKKIGDTIAVSPDKNIEIVGIVQADTPVGNGCMYMALPGVRELKKIEGDGVQAFYVTVQDRSEESIGKIQKAIAALGDNVVATTPGTQPAEQDSPTIEYRRKADPQGPKLIYKIEPIKERYGESDIFAEGMSSIVMDGVLNIVERRINTGAEKKAVVRKLDDRRLEIALMRQDEKEEKRVERLLASAGTLAFRIVASEREKEILELAKKDESKAEVLDENGKVLAVWLPLSEQSKEGIKQYPQNALRTRKEGEREIAEILVLSDTYNINGSYIQRASAEKDDHGHSTINFTFNDAGGELFGKLTSEHLPDKEHAEFGYHLGIILDGKLFSAPRIQTKITARGQISGNFTPEEAADLADILNAGSLPVRLKLLESSNK